MKKNNKRFSNRDGYKVEEVTGLQNILFDLKPNRCEAEVYINSKIDMTSFVEYMANLKKKNPDLTYFHGFIMACAKMLYKFPHLNRFVQNRTLYMHYDVSIGFIVKESFDEKSEEFMSILKIDEEDTIFDISKKSHEEINKIRSSESEHGGGGNDVIDKIGKSWKPFRKFCIGLIKLMDKKFGLPSSIANQNIYYSSMIISNLGTFKVGAIYHNLFNFGSSSFVITFGEVYKEKDKYFMEIGVTMDERIADGFYLCNAFKGLEYILMHPELFIEPAGKDFSFI